MSCNWRKMTLKEAGVILIDCDHKTPKAQESGKPYVGIPQLKDCRITLDGARLISEEDFVHWRRKAKPQEHDVILSRRCNPGETGYVTGDLEIALGQNLVLLRSDGETIYPPFLRWLTRGKYWWNQVDAFINVGAVFESLKCADIPKFEILVPSLEEQKLLTACMSSLDDKIALNTLTNQTLEQMAQTIFKSWFVDFEPVKAKMNGAQPEGMDAATASLFPEKLVESELGLIPEGWELTNIGKVSECFDKKRIPLSKRQREQKQGSIPYYGATSVMDYVDEAIFDDIYLLIGEDGSVMKDDGTPFIQYIWGPAWVNNHAHVLQGIKSISTEQLMLFFQQTNINAYVTGAVQLKINQRNMNSIPFIKAPKEINERFYDVVAPLYAKIRAIKEENEQLAKLRDTLLPKLLSGEIELETATENK
ncbi:restriction endonuclease subunit S [Vibrio breoganii]|uniref:restriction endonuclease subunit S n=1 Tax=Vibrio breoganii TaxID=553239 RepID=UPI000C84723E|nr:restriction endonuclease subunit S [Vibrio breoganii]